MNGLTPITYVKLKALTSTNRYWKTSLDARWAYMSIAIKHYTDIRPAKVLELGAAGIPIIQGSDTLDILPAFKPTYTHDARIIPWPIADKQYDMVIALQVLEHLGNAQVNVFREMYRIAKHVVVSLPFMWNDVNDLMHSNIDETVVMQWAMNVKPVALDIVGTGKRRIIGRWDVK